MEDLQEQQGNEPTKGTGVPPFNKAVIEAYLDYLIKKYDALDGEPFSTKARMAVRNEIESMKVVLEQEQMDETWRNLDSVFGMTSKPKPKDYTYHLTGDFKSKFSKQDLDFDEAW